MFHSFQTSIAGIELPHLFTYPFHYTPHPLCVMAAGEVQAYINKQTRWKEELDKGKMFGVLIVRTSNGQMGYLAAFSGNLCGSNSHSFFVPPVYDLLQPDGFFKIEEEQISAINRRIGQLQNSDRYVKLQQRLAKETASSQQILTEARKTLKTAKEKREQRRQQQPDEDEQAAMIRESQYHNAEFKRLERYWKERISEVKAELESISSQIESLKAERKNRSAALQQKLFEQFGMLGIFFQKQVLKRSKCMIGGPQFTTELDYSQKKLPHLTRRLEILVFHHGPFKRISTDSILQIRSSSYLRNRELKFRLLRNNYIHRMRTIKSDTIKFFKKVIYRITSALCIINRRKYKFYLTGCIVYQLRVVYFLTIFRRGDTIIIPADISIGIYIMPHNNAHI